MVVLRLFLMIVGLWLLAGATHAQERPVAWRLWVDGLPAPAPAGLSGDLEAGAEAVLRALWQEGYLTACLAAPPVVEEGSDTVYVTLRVERGPLARVRSVAIPAVAAVPSSALYAAVQTRRDALLDPQVLEDDLERLAQRLAAYGYGRASVRLARLEAEAGGVAVAFAVEPGPRQVLARLELPGATRTRPAFAARLAGVRVGQVPDGVAPEAVRERLLATGLFRRVGPPAFMLGADSALVLRIPTDEEPPGAFDLVVGLLPGAAGASPQWVGAGRLALANLFGHGRTLRVALDRLPGQASLFDAAVADPRVLGGPLGLEAAFVGRQQDSLFSKQRYEIGARFYPAEGLTLTGSISQERVDPGVAGARLVGGGQRVARARARLAGVGLRYEQVRRPHGAWRGGWVAVRLDRGSQRREALAPGSEGPVLTARSVAQERGTAAGRLYLAPRRGHTFVLGAEAALVVAETYDPADLLRLGGASSLRGYDEDTFRGRLVGRLLAEYRFPLEARSYTFAFFDLGYVDAPALPAVPAATAWHPGYGLGVVVETPVGLINATYALNPDVGPAAGRVHVGVALGL